MAEIVILHDTVSYSHPDAVDKQLPPGTPTPQAYATRGQVLSTEDSDDFDAPPKITEREAKRLVHMGAATDKKDSIEGRLALSGQRPDSRQSALGYASLSSPVEQERAFKAQHGLLGGVQLAAAPHQLSHLTTADVQLMARAFGADQELVDSGDKEKLLEFITGKGDDAMSADEIAEQTQMRDEAQVAARENAATEGSALVGTDVTGSGNRASTGERTTATERGGRRRSAAARPDTDSES